MNQQGEISNNVQALIDHLHDDGVVAGQEEGKKIISDAESRAQWIIEQAKQQASDILDEAKSEAKFINESAHSALQLAVRDLMFNVKEQLQNHLASQLQSLIEQELADRSFMIDLLHEAIEQQWFSHENVKLLIPSKILDLSALSELGDSAEQDPLLPAIRRLAKSALNHGIILENQSGKNGIDISLNEGKVQIVTDDKTLADWLLQFVHPRFRALIDGVIR